MIKVSAEKLRTSTAAAKEARASATAVATLAGLSPKQLAAAQRGFLRATAYGIDSEQPHKGFSGQIPWVRQNEASDDDEWLANLVVHIYHTV